MDDVLRIIFVVLLGACSSNTYKIQGTPRTSILAYYVDVAMVDHGQKKVKRKRSAFSPARPFFMTQREFGIGPTYC